MHIVQEEIGPPSLTSTQGSRGDDTHRIFVITPLPPGYGVTLGNALRRALLSSLPGAAVTSFRVDGIQHEYGSIKGMRESIMDVGLNLKQLHLRKHSKDIEIVTLEAKGPQTVRAEQLKTSSDLEVLNPDLELFTLEKGSSIKMEITVEKGVGYTPASERNKKHNEPNLMYIDSVFSPVERVSYRVDDTRVGQKTNLDKLTIEVMTNGSLTAEEAVQFASQLLTSYFGYFGSEERMIEAEYMADFSRAGEVAAEEAAEAPSKESYTPIEILNLSPRTLNALINAGVGSIEQLVKCSEATLMNFRGFGTKALDEVKEALAGHGLSFENHEE